MIASVEYTGSVESIKAVLDLRKKGFKVVEDVLYYEDKPVPTGTVFTLDGRTFTVQEPL